MKSILSLLFSVNLLLSLTAFSQQPVVTIEEEYTNPEYYMYKKGDEYHPRSIENGMYISKHGSVLPAELSFPLEINRRQDDFTAVLDMEFTLVKVKGKPEDFIFIHIYTDSEMPYLNFAYNELGDWKLGNYLFETIYQSGKTQVKPGTNVVRIEHRYSKLRYFINDIKVTDVEFKEGEDVNWQNMKIESLRNQKTVIGLDKAVLKAYTGEVPFSDDAKKEAAEAAIPKYREVPSHLKSLRFIKFEENGKWGLMNNNGLVLAPAKYDEIGRFNEEFDPIEEGYTRVGLNGHFGYIDSTGKEISKMYYDDAHFAFGEGLAGVSSSGKWGFINTKGETVIPHEFTIVGGFSDGLSTVSKTPDDGMYHFTNKGAIDKTGKVIIDLKYEELQGFVDGLAAFYTAENNKFGFIDKTGKVVIPHAYDYTEGFDPYVHGYATVSMDKADGSSKWGIIDKTGKIIIPAEYDMVALIANNVVYVQNDNVTKSENESKHTSWLIDFAGKQISKKYDQIYIPFNEGGLVGVTLGKKQGFIDKAGKEVIPVIYDLPEYGGNVYFTDGLVELELNGKKVTFDYKGKEVK